VLCPGCRRQLNRSASTCGHCGLARPGAPAALELVLPDGARVPLGDELVLGRAPGSTLQLADPTVSRTHARIGTSPGGGAPVIEDAGSSAGTFVDDAPVSGPVVLRDGARIRLGTVTLGVERRRADDEAGRTIVVRPGASLLVSAVTTEGTEPASATRFGLRPRLRSGYALKRLEAAEGADRWVLRDLRSDRFLRLGERDAELLQQLDGERSLVELIAFAEREWGPTGPARVARLLADLGERGLLAGVDGSEGDGDAPRGRLRRWIGPHVWEVRGLGPRFERLYEHGGWILFSQVVLTLLAVLGVAGVACFAYLVIGRYGTPFVVAQKIGLGGLVFLAGRFAFAAVHEIAHGLTMASFGRRVDRAGLKAVLVFPYVFVDTSEAWFEPRRRRIAIAAAGPVSDLTLGGLFAVLSVVVEGTLREVFFQLAFSAYVGALFNLNPFLDRDGYHILVDVLREPGLRKRARAQFERRLSGDRRATDERALARYSVAATVWAVVGALFAIAMSLRYEAVLVEYAPKALVYVVFAALWLALFVPLLLTVGRPLAARVRG
jgi:putative peptide zinc metalloprotease protein